MQKKVALITGASHRLGGAIALALAQNGYNILLHYFQSKSEALETAKKIRLTGSSVQLLQADLTQVKKIEPMVAQGFEEFGQIDLLVNNTGVFTRKKIPDTSEADWDQNFNLNLKAPFFCSQAVVPRMLQNGGGKIINIASVGGILPYANHCAYSCSKAGLIMLTRCLALELAPSILVNSIAPGSIAFPENPAQTRQMPQRRIPLGRFAEPEEITDLVLFLAEQANYMTGQVLPLDGGRTLV